MPFTVVVNKDATINKTVKASSSLMELCSGGRR